MVTKMAEECASKESGIVQMLEQRNKEDLKLLYIVFSRDTSTYQYIIEKMQPYIQSCGHEIVNDENNLKDPVAFTQKILDLKTEIDELVEYSFDNGILFQRARDISFT